MRIEAKEGNPDNAIRRRLLRVALALGVALAPGPAAAALYTVAHLADTLVAGDGCSLREAIDLHNLGSGASNDCGVGDAAADTIRFAAGLAGKLSLAPALGELLVRSPALTLAGPGSSQIAISGSKSMSILVLDIADPPVLAVRGLTLRDGLGRAASGGWNEGGGAIRMQLGGSVQAAPATIVLDDVVLFNNTCPASGSSYGGAIRSYGKLVLRRTTLLSNFSDLGAIWHEGSAQIEDSTFANNHASFVAGALVLMGSGPWTVRGSLFAGNSAVSNAHTAIVFAGTTPTGLVENCTFVGNFSDTGGVVSSQSPVTIRNSTFYGNYATGSGGTALISVESSTLTLSSNLFGKHEMPELFVYGAGGASVVATRNLFSTAAGALPPAVICGSTTAGGRNLCGVADAGVGSLANHGGPTETLDLLLGSPAIDQGENLGGLASDQRGSGFPRTLGKATDIGAFEHP